MTPKKLPPQTAEIEQARADELRQVKRLAPSKAGIFRRAFEGYSLRKGITAHCLQCSDYSTKEVRNCTVYRCPLRNVRPYQVVKSEKAAFAEDKAEMNNGRHCQ